MSYFIDTILLLSLISLLKEYLYKKPFKERNSKDISDKKLLNISLENIIAKRNEKFLNITSNN